MQISLLPVEPLAPLPTDARFYVPALQNKPGELAALEHAAEDTWQRLVPLIQFVGPLSIRDEPLSGPSIKAWVKKVRQAVGEHPMYLDIIRLKPTDPVATGDGTTPVLRVLHSAARKVGLSFVPVVWVGESSKAHKEIVAESIVGDGHGVALRFRYLRIAPLPGISRRKMVEDLLDELECPAEMADLFIDLEYLDPDRDHDADDIGLTIESLVTGHNWRSVVLLASSMPETLACVEQDSVGTIERTEWRLWTNLAERPDLARLAFGDYAVQHPKPPSGGGPGMRANLRYTSATETLVARGLSVIAEGNEQYQHLCAQVVASKVYCGAPFSWGDETIEQCASGLLDPGAQAMWRGAGTSHHLRFVTDQIARRKRPGSSRAA